MAAGLPTVATPIGAEGLTVVSGTHLVVAEDSAHFADEMVRLLQDETYWLSISKAARQYAEAYHSEEVIRTALSEIIDLALDGP